MWVDEELEQRKCLECGYYTGVRTALDEVYGNDSMVAACPECDLSTIHYRKTMEPPYRCSNCKTDFEEPIIRERKDD